MRDEHIIKKSVNQINIRKKILVISIQVTMLCSYLLASMLFGRGNEYVVPNTINGFYFGIYFFILGLLIGFAIVYFIGKTKLGHIQYNHLQTVIGIWLLFVPLMFTGFIGYSINLKFAEKDSTIVKTAVLDLSGDFTTQTYRILVDLNGEDRKVTVPKKLWNEYSVGDSISLSIINGYFGYDIIRYK